MTRKVYRTAQGKMLDMGALQLRNEKVRAVGNMNVNARGDIVDAKNRPISTRNAQVSGQYKKQTSNARTAKQPKTDTVDKKNIPPEPEDFDSDFSNDAVLGSRKTQSK